MATRIEVVAVPVPPGTPIAAPIVVPMNFDDGRVDGLEIVIPDGPAGLVGFQIRHSKQAIIPYDGVSFLIGNNETIKWPLETFPEADKWDVRIYNKGVFVHTLYFRWLITDVIMAPSLPPLVAIGA